ncbi:MAG: translocation/assembly module TamB domain-containing protein [Saprospiraceae bacterium]|nr:translocation/assembly module TamB domain-containing protein [Saprospiraceae bacterium]
MKEDQENTQFKIVLKWIGYSILVFFLLLFLVSILIQIPLVQNWIVKDVSNRMSRDLGTEVKVGQIRLNFFDDLLIRDLLVRDQQGDTLLYSKKAYFDIDQPLLGLLRGTLSLQSIDLEESVCNLKTFEDATNNYDFLINYFSGDSTAQIQADTNRHFNLIFDPLGLRLNQIVFHSENFIKGQNATLILPHGLARVYKISPTDPLQLNNVTLEQPRLILERYPKSSLVVQESAGTPSTSSGKPDSLQSTQPAISLFIENLQINQGSLQLINRIRSTSNTLPHVINWSDVKAEDIDLEIQNLIWQREEGYFTLDHLDFVTPEGFEVKNIESENVEITSHSVEFSEFIFQTTNSLLTDQLSLKFSSMDDFSRFEDKVQIDARFRDSYIALKDILYFSDPLNYNEFFSLNGGKRIDISGDISGTVNSLKGRNIDLTLADQGFLRGDFLLRNTTSKGEESLSLDVDKAEIELSTLRLLIPNFNPPPTFNKLGLLQFTGNFEGLFHDFVASGDLQTDLGKLQMDMRMNWDEGGFNKASYQGKLQLIDFDLARWMDSDLYGITSFTAEVKDGSGLSANEASANMYAKLEDFYFKGYNYRNAILQGQLNKRFFEGQFYISDPNVTFDFNGHIDFSDTLPKFDFAASVEYINFQALNFSDRKLEGSGDIDFDFTYHDLFNLDGSVKAYDLRIVDDTVAHRMDSIRIISKLNDGVHKNLRAISDIFDFHLIGNFDLRHLPSTIKSLVQKKHPQLALKLHLDRLVPDSLYATHDFHFNGVLEDSKGIQKLFNASLADFKHVVLNGAFENDSFYNFNYRMDLHAPYFQFGENQLHDIALDLSGENARSKWDMYSKKVYIGRKELYPVLFHGTLTSDSLDFSLSAESFANIFSNIDLKGLLYLNDSLFQIDLANSSFQLLDEPWQVVPKNYIQLGDHFVKTENMVFLSNESYIRVTSPGDNSLNLEVEKVDISFLDRLLNKKELAFKGYAYSLLRIDNIFAKSPVLLDLSIDSFQVNDDHYGTMEVVATMPDLDSDGMFDLKISDGRQEFTVGGPFFYPIKGTSEKSLAYDFQCQLRDYPLKIGEYFIGQAVSNTKGTINGKFRFYEEEDRPSIAGEVFLNGATKIDYLGTSYQMVNQSVTLTSNLFDLSGTIISDELGNKAEITGGLVHNHFKKFGMDATIASSYFQFLKTTREENNIYYGTGIGAGTVQFGGDFQRANLRIRATTGVGSRLFIPIEDDFSTDGDAFITYLFDQDSSVEQSGRVNLTGINLDMQLNVTPAAEMQIIFDEFSGDIIRGTGNGNLILTKERAGNLQMTGRYVIDQGQYLYTLLDFINKPFVIDRGGLITWSGDPLNADLNIQARYTGLKVPPRNLIAEYLEGRVSTSDAEIADISTQVDLLLQLRGILSQPQIDFDIRFPEIDPAIRNYTESKMRILKEDVSELNRQVYGLLFFNSFLPSTINLDLTATTVNTLSEFITSQLSNYVAAYITQGVEEVDYISGVDFYFDYNYYRSEDFLQGQQTGVKTGSEFALAPNIRFFDDRLAFSPGASVIEGNVLQEGSAFIGTDVKLEFYVTDDKRLKLSLFYKRFPSLQGSRNKLGLGFRFSKSYDSIGDIFRREKREKAEEIGPGVEVEILDRGKGN